MQNLIFENMDKDVALLKVNRPEALNALNRQTLTELKTFFDQYSYEAPFKVLILIGGGDKSFIAGADIKEMQALDHLGMLKFCELGQAVSCAFAKAPFVIIAAVNGFALGGGLEIALSADFIYASQLAKFGLPEVSLGIIPGFGGTQRLSRLIGTNRAKELMITGRMFSADEAKEMGVLNKICEHEKLLSECLITAKEISQHSLLAALQIKRAIDVGFSLPLEEALAIERNMCAVAFATDARHTGMQAFIEKKRK